MKFTETKKEALIEFWRDVESRTGINIHYSERMEGIDREQSGFTVRTNRNSYRVSAVLLTLGRRGTPRRLGVPGEDCDKVVYNVVDPTEYAGKRVCVVGGGDSALEAAHAIALQPGARVTLSYRSDAFSRAKRKNRDKIADCEAKGLLRVLLGSQILEIGDGYVRIEDAEGVRRLKNDVVVVCAGGVLPTGTLKDIGIRVDTKYGTA
jgi:thioredoxin reductase